MDRAAWSKSAFVFALALLPIALAGCIGGSSLQTDAPLDGVATLAVDGGAPVDAAEGAWFASDELVADPDPDDDDPVCWYTGVGCEDEPVECHEDNCRRFPVELGLPDDAEARYDGDLKVVVQWTPPKDEWAYMQVSVLDADGEALTEGRGGGDAAVAVLEEPAAGTYDVEVLTTYGRATFEAFVQLEPAPEGPARDLLPDLVVLPPTDLRIETPDWLGEGAVLEAAGMRGCSGYEVVERQAQRCLRLSNRVGNIGEGPFEIVLEREDQVTGMAGMGQHLQVIHRSDGSTGVVDAGPASFHPTHTHFHYDGLTEFAVYEHDPATGERGALVNEGNKGGVCLVHSGLIELGLPHTGQPEWGTCFYPVWNAYRVVWGEPPAEDMSMYLASGWYDLYYWGLDDMYVDLTGAGDGVYELVSATNTEGTVTESDPGNNEATVLFRLTGDDVEVLESRASWPGGDGL